MEQEQVDHPAHYGRYSVEVIEITRKMTFDQGNLIKYLLRSPFKGNYRVDLEKAAWYWDDMKRNKMTLHFTPRAATLLTQVKNDLVRQSGKDPRCGEIAGILGDILTGHHHKARLDISATCIREWNRENEELNHG